MTQPIQTLDSALAAIAAEREALQFRQPSALAHVPSSAVSNAFGLPPIPKAPGLVDNLPPHLQSVTRVDVPMASVQHIQNANTQNPSEVSAPRKKSKGMMILGNVVLSACIGAGSVFAMNFWQSSGDMSRNNVAFAKSDLGATSVSGTVGKQDKISIAQSAKMNKSCTIIYQDLMTGHIKSAQCQHALKTADTTVEITQYSSESTSATVNSKKFIESLSTSNNKIAGSLSGAGSLAGEGGVKTLTLATGNQFAQDFSASENLGRNDNDDGGIAFQLKPRGIVKKFYAPE